MPIAFPEVDFDRFNELGIKRYLSRTSYAKFTLTDIIDVDKVLFLDCDILVRRDISALWEIDISKNYAAAVLDTYENGLHRQSIISNLIGLAAGGYYFNSGVLLFNLPKCREDGIMEKAMRFKLQNPDTKYHDQDGFNAVMQGKWLPLNPCWNVQTF